MMKLACIYKDDLTAEFRKKLAKLYIDSNEFYNPLGERVLNRRFAAWWDANPNLDNTTPAAWIITDENTNLYGILPQIPLEIEYKNKKYKASATSSYYAKPEVRGALSAALFLAFDKQPGKFLTYTNTPRPLIRSMISSLGYRNIAPYACNYTYIINYNKYIKYWIFRFLNKIKKNYFVKKDKCDDNFNDGIENIVSHNRYILKICDNIAEFKQYYQLHPQNNQYIGVSRNEATLNWLLFSQEVISLHSRKVLQIFTEKGEYCGYCIYDIKYGTYYPFARISELNLLVPEKSLIKEIIRYLIKIASKNGCFILIYRQLHPNQETDNILRKLFHKCEYTDGNYFVKFRKEIQPCENPYSIYFPSDLDPNYGLN